jgi:hypothetical protein
MRWIGTVEIGQQNILDSVDAEQSADDAEFVDAVDAGGNLVAVELLLEQVHWIQIINHVEYYIIRRGFGSGEGKS